MDYKDKTFLIATMVLWLSLGLIYLLFRFTDKTFKTSKAFWVGVFLTIVIFGAVHLIGLLENRGKKNGQTNDKTID